MFGRISFSDIGQRLVYLLCLTLCEAHINERAQGQLSDRDPTRRIQVLTVLRCLVGEGTIPSGLGVVSPKLTGTQCRYGGISHSQP